MVSLKVDYVTMQFPTPSETFAVRDVKALIEQNVNVCVNTLLKEHRKGKELRQERDIVDVSINHGGWGSIAEGIRWAALNPLKTLRYLRWIITRNYRSPIDLAKSLVLSGPAIATFVNICKRKPDVVHLYWGHYPSLVGYLVGEHAPEIVLTMFLGAYDLSRKYAGTVDVVKHSKVVFTHAETNVSRIRRWLDLEREKIKVIYRGVDIAEIESCTKDYDPNPLRILSAGRLIPEKRMDDVLRAFAIVSQEYNSASLAILGDGPDKNRLTRLSRELGISDMVMFTGHISEKCVLQEMASASIFTLLSDKPGERLPNVVKEAMACQCICIVSRTPGIKELIEHSINGYIVEASDVKGAAEIMLTHLSGNIDDDAMTDRAYHKVCDSFNVQSSMKGYVSVWNDLIS